MLDLLIVKKNGVCVYFQLILQIFAILAKWSTIIAVVGRPPGLVQKPVSYFEDSMKCLYGLVLLQGLAKQMFISNSFHHL